MEKPKHTPAPWQTHHDEYQDFDFVTDKYNNCIAKVMFNDHHIKAGAVRANAQLIAAAPELAEACKKALDCFREMYLKIEQGCEVDELYNDPNLWPLSKLREVLKKAGY